ncbi:MAG TPA: hypothetical protein IAB59_01770 [Candidatus Onthousia faecipullorum]|uniref:Uncharacterized protein n=1 Tax=Candidatus Onthousia faecipullorum TaxID=2840887 RepID=A0A9D1GAG8_9FIRM|nr:hypothetical protein [Candidatus Onthousia faecipullorum]
MSLYDRMLNIANLNKESIIKKAIENTKSDLDGLDYERMCLVYNWYLYENLKDMSCLAYIVDTDDLEFHYKHRFVLVPTDDRNYYLADLTYKQFGKDDEVLNKLYNDGYEMLDNEKYNYYLNKVTGTNKDITIDESLFREAKGLGK